ncbi:hypothetical protein AZH53_02115 [Methanomicrobiaceae archaeon CYW5]|nr:hypothetical protein [Methanovulcanius yangii]
MSFVRSERKCVEILRILSEHQEPIGAKRLSELLAERGFLLTDRAVQYYLQYLDEQGFTHKIGNKGRILTDEGISEANLALIDDRMGFVISKLEKLAFNVTFNPETSTGDVGYNLTVVPYEFVDDVAQAFDEVIAGGYTFYKGYCITDQDPRLPEGHAGFLSACSITMDGVLQNHGIAVNVVYGGRFSIVDSRPVGFVDLIGYKGTTVDPLPLFINAGLTNVHGVATTGTGIALANVREVTNKAKDRVEECVEHMVKAGFVRPVGIGDGLFNLRPDPYRLSIVFFSGMNLVANAVEKGYPIYTEIGAGIMPFSRFLEE